MTTRCLLYALVLCLIFSCEKEQSGMSQLVAFSDNSNKYSITYAGNFISQIKVDSGAGAPYIIANYSYGNNFIRADLHSNTGYSHIDYAMKNASLPLSIKKYKLYNGKDSLVSSVNFYYREGSDFIDSVVLDANTHYNFIPQYSGTNITDYYVCTEYGPPVLSGSFLYYPITNVFRSTNPLLFIYSSPVFQFEAFLLPRLFSGSTLKKFNGGTFTYDTDRKGNLSVEDYGSFYPYKRLYIYR
jgi:hypothetical protein